MGFSFIKGNKKTTETSILINTKAKYPKPTLSGNLFLITSKVLITTNVSNEINMLIFSTVLKASAWFNT